MSKINLLDFSELALKSYVKNLGEKEFHATQIFKWIHQHGCSDVDTMTNLSLNLRNKLQGIALVSLPEILNEKISSDGSIKWLLKLNCGSAIETVYIPEKGRGTLCVSSQAGCPLHCRFCFTTQSGFKRNLTVAEIVGQLRLAVNRLTEIKELETNNIQKNKIITNVVYMGMGEPLLNYSNVVDSLSVLMNDNGYGLSKYKVTVSTSGVVPKLIELSKISDAALTISLHAANNVLRNELVPINQKYPLEQLIDACRNYYPKQSNRKITFAYVMLRGVNDSDKDARDLVRLLSSLKCKVNLIPFNEYPGAIFTTSCLDRIEEFRNILVNKGIQTTIRKTRGKDIKASCGQLAGELNKTNNLYKRSL